MAEIDRKQKEELARALEKKGDQQGAARAYLEAGSVLDAARVIALRDPAQAGELILQRLAVPVAEAAKTDGARKNAFRAAAGYLAKGGDTKRAVEIYVALGDPMRAADILERAGDHLAADRLRTGGPGKKLVAASGLAAPGAHDPLATPTNLAAARRLEAAGKADQALPIYIQLRQLGEAARVARELGRTAEAAKLYAEAALPFEAAQCYLELGDTGIGLDYLVRVPRDDERYRAAAQTAIRVAVQLNVVDVQFEYFITRYVSDGPQEARDLELLYALARLYRQHGLDENAREALGKILAADPRYRDAQAQLDELSVVRKVMPGQRQRMLEQDESFYGRSMGRPAAAATALPDLPDLPELAPLPPLPSLNAPAGAPPTAPAPAEPEVASFTVGSTLAKRYQITGKLGEGGMAVVFRAHDIELDEDVAIKVFTQALSNDQASEETIARFKLELKLTRQLNHPNIIRLYDIGLAGRHRYISMEMLVGKSLEDFLTGPLDVPTGVAYLVQACAGLQAAHDCGVVHRDIKPDNLFVTREGQLKIMDFGIAKQRSTPGVTVAGMVAGTPEYMAPEQINNFSNVTPAADLYSLGIVAFRMFTGALPFTHEELVPLLMMHINEQPPTLRSVNPAVPPAIEAVVLKTLAKDPAQRFASARDLARALIAARG